MTFQAVLNNFIDAIAIFAARQGFPSASSGDSRGNSPPDGKSRLKRSGRPVSLDSVSDDGHLGRGKRKRGLARHPRANSENFPLNNFQPSQACSQEASPAARAFPLMHFLPADSRYTSLCYLQWERQRMPQARTLRSSMAAIGGIRRSNQSWAAICARTKQRPSVIENGQVVQLWSSKLGVILAYYYDHL